MKSDNLQMRGPQPHPQSALPPYSTPAPSAAPAPALVFKTRFPSACKECRRRKQKCSLTQPCTNCARRFPQPTCEYGVERVRRSTHAPASEARNNVVQAGGGLYSHLDMDSVHDALLQVEGQTDLVKQQLESPPTPVSSLGYPSPAVSRAGQHLANHPFTMDGRMPDAQQLLRLRFKDRTGALNGHDIIELLQYILKTRLNVTNSIVKDEWEIDGAHLIRAIQGATPPANALARFDDEIRYLPMAPTKMNKELIRTHLQLMSRFKASLDGSPRPNNRFMKHWIPYSIQDPLVLHVVLCSTASFLNETGRIPKVILLVHRATVTRMLNEHIGNPRLCTNDSAMLAVAQLILTSWYWGSTEELHAHMSGFKRMIEMRGSIENLGMEGYTSKVALIDDFVIALAHETEPLMFGEPGFEFHDPLRVPLQVNFNSPLLFDCPPFVSPASPLQLHPQTAQILDEVRTLSKAVVDLPDNPSIEDLESVHRTAVAAFAAVSQTPEDVALQVEVEAPDPEPAMAPGAKGAGLKRKRQGDDTSAPRKAGTTESDVRAPASDDGPPDMVHRCVRMTALVYCHAILNRVPTSQTCSMADFGRIWGWAWQAGLDRWSSLSGIFAWMMIAIVASSHHSLHGRMTKTLMVTAFMYLGTENWHIAADIATAGLKIQRWLRGGRSNLDGGMVSGAFGGESVVERLGFAFKDDLPEVVPVSEDAVEGTLDEDD